MNSPHSKSSLFGALSVMLAVILGAFGAHALKATLLKHGSLETWKTAVDYQMWHGLALLLIPTLQLQRPTLQKTVCLFCVGTLLFSGSLYALSLGGPKWLGPITPLGGLSYIVGWALIAWSQIKNTKHPSD